MTFEEAKKNLLEVIKIQFQEMAEMGTLGDYLAERDFILKDDQMIPFLSWKSALIGVQN
jgi:hypothetical protein